MAGCRFFSVVLALLASASLTAVGASVPTPTPPTNATCVVGIGGKAQCGGKNYPAGAPTKCCDTTAYCKFNNTYWSDCQKKPATPTPVPTPPTCVKGIGEKAQCGGKNYPAGAPTKCCDSTAYCKFNNAYWSDCQKKPATPTPVPTPPTCVVGIGGKAQCGGKTYPAGAPTKCCDSTAYCKFNNTYWSDCQKKPSAPTPVPTTPTP